MTGVAPVGDDAAIGEDFDPDAADEAGASSTDEEVPLLAPQAAAGTAAEPLRYSGVPNHRAELAQSVDGQQFHYGFPRGLSFLF